MSITSRNIRRQSNKATAVTLGVVLLFAIAIKVFHGIYALYPATFFAGYTS